MASNTHLEPSRHPVSDDGVTTAERIAELSTRVATLTAEIGSLRQQRQTISTFERLRGALRSHYETPLCKPPSISRLDAPDFSEAAEGIHFLEYTPSGVGFHWTGPDQVTRFTMFVDRSVPVMVRLSLFLTGRLSDTDVLTADIDGVVYPFSRTGRKGVLVAGPVAPRAGERKTDILLHVPVMFSPDSGSGDTRWLGVAITSIALEPVH